MCVFMALFHVYVSFGLTEFPLRARRESSQSRLLSSTPAENRKQGGMKQIVEQGLNLSGS